MTSVYLLLLGIFLCVCCSAFFSAAEMSYSTCNELRLQNLVEAGSTRAKLASYIVDHYDNALSTILIGNNLANIAGSSLASLLLMAVLGEELGTQYAWVSTLVMTLVIIVCGETVPKISAKKNSNKFALKFSYVIRGLMMILAPVVWVVVKLIHLITLPFKGSKYKEAPEEKVEELQSMIETAEDEDVLDEDQSELVKSAIDFSDISAYEVMTARVDMFAVDIEDDTDELYSRIENSSYSRIPVYEGNIDNIIGILYMNHFLKARMDDEEVDIRRHLMQPVYVYKTMKLPDVLSKLRKSKQHLAIVVDEYGGVLGVVSMEDVLEEIVGDIWDESDVVEQEVVRRSEDEFELDGYVTIAEFCDLIGINENKLDVDSDTVGGWTVESFGEFPKPGDSFEFENVKITVLEMDKRRVEKVLVHINKVQEEK